MTYIEKYYPALHAEVQSLAKRVATDEHNLNWWAASGLTVDPGSPAATIRQAEASAARASRLVVSTAQSLGSGNKK